MACSRSCSPDSLSINKILDELSEMSSDRESDGGREQGSGKAAALSRTSSWSSEVSSSSSSSSSLAASSGSSSEDDESTSKSGPPPTLSVQSSSSASRECRSLPESPMGSLSSILDSPKRLSQSCPRQELAAGEAGAAYPSPARSVAHRVKRTSEVQERADQIIEDRSSSERSSSGSESSASSIGTRSAERSRPAAEAASEVGQSPPPVQTSNASTKEKSKDMRSLKVDLLELSPRPDDQSTPSPLFGRRSPVGALGWRPVMPGYQQPKVDGNKLSFVDGDGSPGERPLSRSPDMSLKDYIPVMSKPLAVICLVLNVVSPGLGTLLAGVSVLFCSSPRPVGIDKAQCLWVNTWVSVLQLLTTFLVLLGWIWSVMWGVAFLSVSSRVGDDKDKDLGVCHLDTVDGNSPRMNNVDSVPDDVRNSSAVNTTTANSARSTPLSSTVAPQAVSAIGYYQPDAAAPIPMIILHDNPLSLTAIGGMEPSNGGGRGHHQRALNPYNPRHLRVIRRQEDELLPSYLLDGQALENIVIRNAPVPDQIVFGHQEAPPISDDADEGYTKGYATGDLESFGEQLAEASYAPSTSRSSGDAALTSRRSRRNSRQRLL